MKIRDRITTGILIWGDHPDETRKVTSKDELKKTLGELTKIAEADGPLSILLRVDSETGIQIIVGLDISTVQFYSASSQPQHVGSIGSLEYADNNDWVSFNHRGELSEVPQKYFIPIEDAREAILYYFTTGLRPNNIKWSEMY